MNKIKEKFIKSAKIKAFDPIHRFKLKYNINKYDFQVTQGKKQFKNSEEVKSIAHFKKKQALDNLGELLIEFEKNLTARGGYVHWAENAQEANQIVLSICEKHQAKLLVKSKSMVTEEIHLNDFLKKHNIESVETDLGEFIQQLDNEPPYHIVTPAMHKSKEDVAKIFHTHLGTPLNYTPEQLTMEARKQLREKFSSATVGVTGVNFILPDIGGVAITENEGNARLSMSLPKVHIAIGGIEKIIPSYKDLALFWPLLATFGTGQKLTVYNTIISAGRINNETDGPKEFHVILLDNGRTNLLKDVKLRQSLYCIRCGACLNTCPIYKSIGGHTYGVTYSGPIGKVISSHLLNNLTDYGHLAQASSLCGSCTEVCPVKIPLHQLILYNRQISVSHKTNSIYEKWTWNIWQKAMTNRSLLNLSTATVKSKVVKKLFPSWTKYHSSIPFPKKSFNQVWLEQRKNTKK